MTAASHAARLVPLVLGLVAVAASASAQTPPASPPVAQNSPKITPSQASSTGDGRSAPQAPASANRVTNVQVQEYFDAYVISQSQRALQLSNRQVELFLPRLIALQKVQRQHRNQRNKAIADLRALVGPNAPQGVEDASIVAATKVLDDLEAQMQQDEQRALGALDAVLTVRQRAHFRLFLENMEREKINMLVQAKGGGEQVPAAPSRAGGRRGP